MSVGRIGVALFDHTSRGVETVFNRTVAAANRTIYENLIINDILPVFSLSHRPSSMDANGCASSDICLTTNLRPLAKMPIFLSVLNCLTVLADSDTLVTMQRAEQVMA